jgi:glutamate decarboxylase
MPPALEDLDVLRVVVRNGFSDDLADLLLADLGHKTAMVAERGRGGPSRPDRVSFHH